MKAARPFVEKTTCRRICEYVPGIRPPPPQRDGRLYGNPSPRRGEEKEKRDRCPRVLFVRLRRTRCTRGYSPWPRRGLLKSHPQSRSCSSFAQQLGSDEVDKTLAPAGLLHHQQPAATFHDVADRFLLTFAEINIRKPRPKFEKFYCSVFVECHFLHRSPMPYASRYNVIARLRSWLGKTRKRDASRFDDRVGGGHFKRCEEDQGHRDESERGFVEDVQGSAHQAYFNTNRRRCHPPQWWTALRKTVRPSGGAVGVRRVQVGCWVWSKQRSG